MLRAIVFVKMRCNDNGGLFLLVVLTPAVNERGRYGNKLIFVIGQYVSFA